MHAFKTILHSSDLTFKAPLKVFAIHSIFYSNNKIGLIWHQWILQRLFSQFYFSLSHFQQRTYESKKKNHQKYRFTITQNFLNCSMEQYHFIDQIRNVAPQYLLKSTQNTDTLRQTASNLSACGFKEVSYFNTFIFSCMPDKSFKTSLLDIWITAEVTFIHTNSFQKILLSQTLNKLLKFLLFYIKKIYEQYGGQFNYEFIGIISISAADKSKSYKQFQLI